MPADNVVPINPQARIPDPTRTGDRTPRRFRWFVAGLTVVWAGALTAALLLTPFPALWQLLVLAALVVAAEHRFVLFGDETSMSASIVVILCAVTFWRSDAYLVGPMLVASCGGLLFAHLRGRNFTLIAANGTSFSISAAAGALAVHGLSPGRSFAFTLVCSLIAGASYWTSNSILTGLLSALRNDSPVGREISIQIKSEINLSLIGISAAIVGYFAANPQHQFAIAFVAVPLALFELTPPPRSGQFYPRWVFPGAVALVSISSFAPATALESLLGFAAALAAVPILIAWSNRGLAIAGCCFGIGAGLIALLTHNALLRLAFLFMTCVAVMLTLRFVSAKQRSRANEAQMNALISLGFLVPGRDDLGIALASASFGWAVLSASSSLLASIGPAVAPLICAAITLPKWNCSGCEQPQVGSQPIRETSSCTETWDT